MTQKELSDGTIVDFTPEEEQQLLDEQTASIEAKDRSSKAEEIKVEGMSRIQVHLPGVEGLEDLANLKNIHQAFQLTAAGNSAKDIYVYARTKIDQAATAPIADVRAYDPVTDANWPT